MHANVSVPGPVPCGPVARRLLLSRGIRPIVGPLAWRASKEETASDPSAASKHDDMTVTETRNIMDNAISYAKEQGMVQTGDMVVGVHRIVGDSIMKILQCH